MVGEEDVSINLVIGLEIIKRPSTQLLCHKAGLILLPATLLQDQPPQFKLITIPMRTQIYPRNMPEKQKSSR